MFLDWIFIACLLDTVKSIFSWSAETRCLYRVSGVMDPFIDIDADVPVVVPDASMYDPPVSLLPTLTTYLL